MPKSDRTFPRLALYLQYGLPLIKGLELAIDEADSPATAKALATIKTKIEAGSSVAEAMRGIPAYRAHADFVAIAEETGLLEFAFADIGRPPSAGAFLTWLHRQLPYKLVGDAVAAAAVVLPPKDRKAAQAARGVKTLAEAAARLPGLFPAPAAAAFAGAPDDAELRQRLLDDLASAVERGLFRPATKSLPDAQLRMFIGLWLLIRAGVPLVDALKAIAPAVAHPKVSRTLKETAEKLAGGSNLTEPLEESGLFSKSMVEMVRLAETCGALDNASHKIAEGIAAGLFR